MKEEIVARFKQALPSDIRFCSLRYIEEVTEELSMRRGVLQPVGESIDRGLMITVHNICFIILTPVM